MIDGPVPPAAEARAAPASGARVEAARGAATPSPTATQGEAASLRSAASACHSLALPDVARPVTDTTVRGALPSATGGVVRDGLYVLVRTESHRSFANLFERRMVLRVQAGTFEAVTVRGSESPLASRGTVRMMAGSRIMFRVECPGSGQMEFDHYSVTDDGLVLQDEETQRVVMLAREDAPGPSPAEPVAPAAPVSEPASAPEPAAAVAPPPEAATSPPARPPRRRGGHRR
ncbi:MAG: hypothetical protein Q8S73_11860 [Deltaproteobacteria bacterium]|nr:hypothetical protein [Myxococcales bacterium]MDP3214793.1 hypothetical protein [Deltaproteobacteria bacterium]